MMMQQQTILLVTLVSAGLAVTASARAQNTSAASEDAVPGTQPAGDQLARSSGPSYSSVDPVPQKVLDDDRRPVIILPTEPADAERADAPRSGGVVARVQPGTQRFPEGFVIGSRPANLSLGEEGYVARIKMPEDHPECPPLNVLPNQWLEVVEAILAASDGPPRFLITGRITEFHGRNYLLLENVAQLLNDAGPATMQPAGASATPSATSAASRPADGPAPGKLPDKKEPRPEDVIRSLMAEEPLKAVVLPQLSAEAGADEHGLAPDEDASSADPYAQEDGKAGPSWPEGTLLVDRLGRVVSQDGGWVLAFEDRGLKADESPIRLLPNRLLETAIALSRAGTKGVVFNVSGEVTQYQKHNYLLLRKILVKRDMGNLR